MNGNQGIEGLFRPNLKRRGASVRNKTEKAVEKPRNVLFGDIFKPSCDAELGDKILGLTRKHSSVISVMKSVDSKVCGYVVTYLRELVGGTFMFAHDWERRWLSNVANKYPIETLKFQSVESVLSKVDSILGYCNERKGSGFWFPKTRDGKVVKVSLADFLVSQTRSGGSWSPFVELCCVDCVTPKMLMDTMSESLRARCEEIYEETWFTDTYQSRVSYLKGAIAFTDWYKRNRDVILSSNANKVRMADIDSVMVLVRDANKATHCVYPSFISDNNDSWKRFRDWCVTEMGLELNESMT